MCVCLVALAIKSVEAPGGECACPEGEGWMNPAIDEGAPLLCCLLHRSSMWLKTSLARLLYFLFSILSLLQSDVRRLCKCETKVPRFSLSILLREREIIYLSLRAGSRVVGHPSNSYLQSADRSLENLQHQEEGGILFWPLHTNHPANRSLVFPSSTIGAQITVRREKESNWKPEAGVSAGQKKT